MLLEAGQVLVLVLPLPMLLDGREHETGDGLARGDHLGMFWRGGRLRPRAKMR